MVIGLRDVKLGSLFRPVAGVLPSGVVTDHSYSATEQTYTNITTVAAVWNAPFPFNNQGQLWQPRPDAAPGVINSPLLISSGGTLLNGITEFEFLFTGSKLDIAFTASSYYDSQIYVELGHRMYKVQSVPLAGTTTGLMHRRLIFPAPYHGRIRVHLGGGQLIGVKTEQSSIIKPSPDRPLGITDGGELVDGLGFKQASGSSYLTGGLCDYLFERTGFAWARMGSKNTGFFHNGTSAVTVDTPTTDGKDRWFGTVRKLMLQEMLSKLPAVYLLVGTRADGGISGATGSSTGPMATRALACYEWIRSKDQFCTLAHVSPSPFVGAGAAGTLTGAPTANNGHDLNRKEQVAALAKVSRSVYINSFGPTLPWYNLAQQAQLIGADGVNHTAIGEESYASRIALELAQSTVDLLRSRGIR